MGSPESSIRRVSLPQEGKNALVFSSWDQLSTSFQQLTTPDAQQIPVSLEEVVAERKLRKRRGEIPNYSKEEFVFYRDYHERPFTDARHIETVLKTIKTAVDNGNSHTTTNEYILFGKALFGSRIQVEPYSHNETTFYKVGMGSTYLGNRLEDVLESSGVERATQPKLVRIEYAQKDGKFTVDFDDVSERLRMVLQSDDEHLRGNSLVDRLNKSPDTKEKVIALGNYEGFSLRMHCRHGDGFSRKEGNRVEGRVPTPVEGGWVPATVDISIASSGVKRANAKTDTDDIIVPEQRGAAQNLAERIARAFRNESSS